MKHARSIIQRITRIGSHNYPYPVVGCRGLSQHTQAVASRDYEEDIDFGDYSVILPQEPFVWGTGYIQPRSVPLSIHRPVYALDGSDGSAKEPDVDILGGLIKLRGEEEFRLRAAADLAKRTLQYSGTLVKVG